MGFLDIVFPEKIYCINCDALIDNRSIYSLCDSCNKKINWNNDKYCSVCGRAIFNISQNICGDCKSRVHNFDRGYCVTSYSKYEKHLISEYKFNGKPYIGKYLSSMMIDYIKYRDIDFDLLAYVPMTKSKLKKRGFNQSELISKYISREFRKPIIDGFIRNKSDNGISNKQLDRKSRFYNISNSFLYRGNGLFNKSILLIDDIYTTGATVDECSLTLKKSGAKKVDFLVFSAGLDRS